MGSPKDSKEHTILLLQCGSWELNSGPLEPSLLKKGINESHAHTSLRLGRIAPRQNFAVLLSIYRQAISQS